MKFHGRSRSVILSLKFLDSGKKTACSKIPYPGIEIRSGGNPLSSFVPIRLYLPTPQSPHQHEVLHLLGTWGLSPSLCAARCTRSALREPPAAPPRGPHPDVELRSASVLDYRIWRPLGRVTMIHGSLGTATEPLAKSNLDRVRCGAPLGLGRISAAGPIFFCRRRKIWDLNPSSSHPRAPKGRISWWLGGYGGQELGGITEFPASAGGGGYELTSSPSSTSARTTHRLFWGVRWAFHNSSHSTSTSHTPNHLINMKFFTFLSGV